MHTRLKVTLAHFAFLTSLAPRLAAHSAGHGFDVARVESSDTLAYLTPDRLLLIAGGQAQVACAGVAEREQTFAPMRLVVAGDVIGVQSQFNEVHFRGSDCWWSVDLPLNTAGLWNKDVDAELRAVSLTNRVWATTRPFNEWTEISSDIDGDLSLLAATTTPSKWLLTAVEREDPSQGISLLSADGGVHWQSREMPGTPSDIVASESSNRLLVLAVDTLDGVYSLVSSNGADDEWQTLHESHFNVSGLAMEPSGNGYAFGVTDMLSEFDLGSRPDEVGLWLSSDLSKPATRKLELPVHCLQWWPDMLVACVTTANGENDLAISRDGGDSFEFLLEEAAEPGACNDNTYCEWAVSLDSVIPDTQYEPLSPWDDPDDDDRHERDGTVEQNAAAAPAACALTGASNRPAKGLLVFSLAVMLGWSRRRGAQRMGESERTLGPGSSR
jgi:hypothetical protein